MPTPPQITLRGASTLSITEAEAILALCDEAQSIDGVSPLNEHTVLHVRHAPHNHGESLEVSEIHLMATTPGESDVQIVGYAHLDVGDPAVGAEAEVVVHPAWRRQGIGHSLVQRAIEASPGGQLQLWAHGLHHGARALATSMGFTETRRLEQWRRSLLTTQAPPLATPALPPGVTIRTFQPDSDDAAWLALNAKAFADHPEQGSWTAHDLAARITQPWFDPAGFLIAEHDGQMVAFHWTKVHSHAATHEPIGEVYVVGVDPAWQGHGLGKAMTLAGLIWLRDQGLTQALLYVDADNVSAKAVYRGLAFSPWSTDVMFMGQHMQARGDHADTAHQVEGPSHG